MYQTKQKKQLIEYFKENTHKQLSMNEIISDLCPDGTGKSTIYRLISKLTLNGTLIKMQGEDAKSVLYQYAGEECECSSHFHLKCSQCGILIHLDCDHIANISKHIFDEHNFNIDMRKTVMYGLCGNCSKGLDGGNV